MSCFPYKYGWDQFCIGQERFYPDTTSSYLHGCVRLFAKRMGWKFKMRREGFGVWVQRVA